MADTAPAVFAVCEKEGEGDMADGWVVAWGLVWEGGLTYVVSADGGQRTMVLTSAERALWWCGQWRGADVRLVWLGRSGRATLDAAEASPLV